MSEIDVRKFVDERGGYRAVAASLGVPITTVHYWLRIGRVPRWRRSALLALPKPDVKAPKFRKRKATQ